ncbi:MAG TPA: CBS domain-containing protein [Actinospica sp.]|jgi:CBS-domain-containing membrane protein|nr:CBS domain-containing protein [Actinospica sp.]
MTTTQTETRTARDLMSPVDNVIGEDATLRDAVVRFQGGRRHLIVLDRDGRCTGVLGPRHVAQAHRLDLRHDEEIPLADLCAAPWIALSPWDSLRTCAQQLVEYDLDAIPVLDDDRRVLGLVTARDIVRVTADRPPHRHPRWRD